MAYDEAAAGQVRNLLAGRSDVVEKKMMGGLCFMVGGHMCCVVSHRGGLMVRVGPEAYQTVLDESNVEPIAMRGHVMTGFVHVAPEGYRTGAGLRKWVKRGVDFVATMPSKPPASKPARHKASKRAQKG